MNQLLSPSRILLAKLGKSGTQQLNHCALLSYSKRLSATEADPDEYGYQPDPIEHAWGLERKMLIARLKGDDRYEPKIYYRADQTTRDYPNLVPVHYQDKVVGCLCEPDGESINYWHLRKGDTKRCECGHWFKGVQADMDSFC
uniref:Cytochrome c oxidase subunit Vb n=1 Tax=Globodera rostochiensis TaxID=31243 RepID=A0A914HFK1_GLORO